LPRFAADDRRRVEPVFMAVFLVVFFGATPTSSRDRGL
jgi:hypothetical protein